MGEGCTYDGRTTNLGKATSNRKLITQFFRKSPKAARVLEEQQKRLILKVLRLKMVVETRWNTACEMFERLWSSRPAVSASLGMVRGTRKSPPPDLTADEWSQVENVLEVLVHFKEVTAFISGQRHPTVGFVMPLYARLIEVTAPHAEDLPVVREMRSKIHEDVAGRWVLLTERIPTVEGCLRL